MKVFCHSLDIVAFQKICIRLLIFLNLGGLLVSQTPLAQEDVDQKRATLERLKKLNLKELAQIQFYNPEAISAARKNQKLLETPAALFVITQEDIRRAGITSIPEALRLAPGVQVARLYGGRWAISTRGLNGFISSKLLVMIDGRTVYTTRNATVHWDTQDLLIENIKHIEVIRGPGASLWGANAVNGIINIITKTAQKTQGTLVTTHWGIGEERNIVGIRHGGKTEKAHYRVYAKLYEHDSFVDALSHDQQDNGVMKRGGFRSDMNLNPNDQLTIQGDIHDGFTKRFFFYPLEPPSIVNHHTYINGFNLLARWQRKLTQGDMTLQSYYNLTKRDQTLIVKETRGTYDLDFQHRWQPNTQQEYIWGLGFRYIYDEFENYSAIIAFDPQCHQEKIFSAFGQAEFILQPRRWKLILGSKFEHNERTGFEYQPSSRVLWTPDQQHSVWAALSRAVRTPSRYDRDFEAHVRLSPDLRVKALGNPHFQSEILKAYELGYRFTPILASY